MNNVIRLRRRQRCETCSSYNKGSCDDEHFIYTADGAETPTDGLGYGDSESYGAYFEVGPDFGCTHWKNKEG